MVNQMFDLRKMLHTKRKEAEPQDSPFHITKVSCNVEFRGLEEKLEDRSEMNKLVSKLFREFTPFSVYF